MGDGKSAPSQGELVAGNYQILGTAGSGGMGVVYRALDVKLQRTLALKFLPAELNASEREKQRFLQEARTASALDHPNIGVIYGIEETADDRTFIAMAYYEGQSLAQRIRSGPIAPAEAAEIAVQVLKALDYAHTQGIEHRDVKPSNIMLTQQRLVKLVDFGLAHVSQQTASKTHGISGTVAYMSPEQTLGRGVDCRSDLWAVGVVLEEMLTGHNPFLRETVPATVFSILNEAPPVPDTLPPGLRHVLYRALAKDPVRRYQSGAEMLRDLEALLAELSPEVSADTAAAANGAKKLKESIELRRSRESASAAVWMLAPPKKAGWKPWAFGMGGVVVLLAVGLLVPPVRERMLSVAARVSGTSTATGRSAASQDYLAALSLLQRFDKQGNVDRAIASLQAAVQADPLFALGHAELGEAYRLRFRTEHNAKDLDLALASCEKAEQLDDRLPAVYTTLAYIHDQQGKHDLALQEFHQALDINPRDANALTGIAHAEESAGNLEDAERDYKKAVAVMPDDWSGYNELATFHRHQGKYALAVSEYRQGLALSADNADLYSNLGGTYVDEGNPQFWPDAERCFKKSLEIQPSYEVLANFAVLDLNQKKFKESAEHSEQALAINGGDYIVWDNLREAYEHLGEKEKARATMEREFALVQQAISNHSDDGWTQALLGDLYAMQGKPDQAEARIQAALVRSPNDPQVLQEVADAYENLKQHDKAKSYIKLALVHGADIKTIREDVELRSLGAELEGGTIGSKPRAN